MEISPSRIALRTSLLYAAAGVAWILTSDGAMLAVSRDPAVLARLSVFKGWAFVGATALLLYATLRTQLARWAAEVARREAAEAEGRAAAERLRKLSQAVEHSSAGILITDRRGLIEYANARFTQMSGYTPEEVIGRSPGVLKSGETSRDEYARLWATISRGEAWHGDFHNRRKDGTLYWERTTIVPIVDAAGAVTHFLNIKDDVTEARSLEAQFRQAQKMEVLGALAGGVAHDFNNLLTVILNNASLLAMPEADAAEAPELVREIYDAAERAAGLTRQLLLFARKQAPRPVDLDVREAVQGLAKMLRRVVGAQIAVETSCADEPLVARADAGMLDQAVMNLSVNARDAMPDGGRLTLRATSVSLDEAEARAIRDATPGRFAVIEVSDTGAGIRPSVLPHIFEPFFTTKEAGRGTGLGLATVYGIARQHRGWVDVRSEPGAGTTFRLALPLGGSGRVERASERVGMVRGAGTLLVVEDEASVREGAARALRQCGYRVLEAGSAAEAERALAGSAAPVDLAIVDLLLPGGVTGPDLAAALRARAPAMRVLFTSGYDPEGGHARPVPAGEAFLQKPFTAGGLSIAVARALRGTSLPPAS